MNETSDPSAEAEAPGFAHNCFVCGHNNPIGLKLHFRVEEGVCRSEFTPGENHEGYPGVVHGGMIFSALDDVMANWLYLQGARAYTAKCEIRFKKAASVGGLLRLEGRHLETRGKLVRMEGRAVRDEDGAVVAESLGTFMVINADEFKMTVEVPS